MTGTMKHLQRNGQMRADRDRRRMYVVRVEFLNPNADYDLTVAALNKNNALWVAAEALHAAGHWPHCSIGEIRLAA
jgi:hypothetical protein